MSKSYDKSIHFLVSTISPAQIGFLTNHSIHRWPSWLPTALHPFIVSLHLKCTGSRTHSTMQRLLLFHYNILSAPVAGPSVMWFSLTSLKLLIMFPIINAAQTRVKEYFGWSVALVVSIPQVKCIVLAWEAVAQSYHQWSLVSPKGGSWDRCSIHRWPSWLPRALHPSYACCWCQMWEVYSDCNGN